MGFEVRNRHPLQILVVTSPRIKDPVMFGLHDLAILASMLPSSIRNRLEERWGLVTKTAAAADCAVRRIRS